MAPRRIGVLVLLLGGIASVVVLLGNRETRNANSPSIGPLRPGEAGRLCVPANQTVAVEGAHVLRNPSSNNLQINRVRLIEPRGLRIQASYLTPILNETLIGLQSSTPSPGSEGYPAWQQRIPAEGAVLPAREERNLVIVLEATGSGVHEATDVEVIYEDATNTFRYTTGKKVQVHVNGQSC